MDYEYWEYREYWRTVFIVFPVFPDFFRSAQHWIGSAAPRHPEAVSRPLFPGFFPKTDLIFLRKYVKVMLFRWITMKNAVPRS